MKAIKVAGMTCEHCEKTIYRAMKDIKGIENINVDMKRGEVTFDETERVNLETLVKAIEDAGYTPGEVRTV